MNIRYKIAFALFTVCASSGALANTYHLSDVGHGSTVNEALKNVQSQIRAKCKSLGGHISNFKSGPFGKENGRWYYNMTGTCVGAN
ncbi:MAG TPA: hypothetical protein VK519_14310 [Pinirhizobacter sp.]|uniref:hypothetical protein n=1 Tax=Pinirhizobacter sp. TaxID=2950432 RepID=UPI002CB50E19|nr:hypothetical protein [Pinirhizobacter sp.]HMH69083.1 hypothetical protein [Pinirhizobacter sp.]